MANRKVDPEKKRIPVSVTIQKYLKERAVVISISEDKSLSEWIEDLIKEKFE